MLRVSWLGVIVPYISYMFLISLLWISTGLSDIWHLAVITCEVIDSALVKVLGIIGWFRFCELLYGVGTLKGNSHVHMFEEFCDLPYFRAMVCESPFFVFVVVFFTVLILVGFFGVVFVVLDAVGVFPENYCFVWRVHSVCFRSVVSGSNCILVIWCLYVAILCSKGVIWEETDCWIGCGRFSDYVDFKVIWFLNYKKIKEAYTSVIFICGVELITI